MSVKNDYSTFDFNLTTKEGATKNSKKPKKIIEKCNNTNSDDDSSDIQSTSLVVVPEQSVEASQNGNHAPPKRYF